jgi:hypothetical protein
MSRRAAIILLLFLGCVGLAVAVRISMRMPTGEWDAIGIWNAKARVILEGGDIWTTQHPDYPLLLPSVVALLWRLLGSATPAVPAVISVAFAAATVVLLIRAVRHHRSETAGFVSGCMMLSSPFFIIESAAQYADIPLSFFILASLSGLEAPLMAGVMAGVASCVKNEGLLFVMAMTIALLIIRRSILLRFLIGAAPGLAGALYFKLLSPSNDVLSSLTFGALVERLGSPGRYGQVFSTLALESLNVLWWGAGTAPILIISLIWARRRVEGFEKLQIRVVAITLAIMLLGFVTIYLVTPWDLDWHLRTSANRLILQLWPSSLYLFFLLVRWPEVNSVVESSQSFPNEIKASSAG